MRSVALLGAVLAALPAWSLDLAPCRITGTGELRSVAAECGTLTVPENPDDPDGPTIDLFVARVEALNPVRESVAFTTIAGGPGQASTEFYVNYAAAFARVNRNRDIVLVDQRGTGRSNALDCTVPEGLEPMTADPEELRRLTRECLDALPGDPRYYTTSVAVRDLDAVRDALGYEQLDIYGVSYGTRVAQHYLRRNPAQTRTVVLDGVVPADVPLGPGIALDAQAALDQAFARCEADEACGTRFTGLRGGFERLLDQVGDDRVAVTMIDPVTGEPGELLLGGLEMRGAVRLLSYTTETVSLLPLLIHTAHAEGNLAPLAAQAKLSIESVAEALSLGMHNAVVCTEDVPYFDGHVDKDALERTYLGTLQIDGLRDTCELWPAGFIDDGFKTPVVSDAPVLVLSGEADPVTPPAFGERVMSHLANARHIVNVGQGHGQAGLGCMPRLLAEFVETADADALDVSCTERLQPAPFFLDFNGPSP